MHSDTLCAWASKSCGVGVAVHYPVHHCMSALVRSLLPGVLLSRYIACQDLNNLLLQVLHDRLGTLYQSLAALILMDACCLH